MAVVVLVFVHLIISAMTSFGFSLVNLIVIVVVPLVLLAMARKKKSERLEWWSGIMIGVGTVLIYAYVAWAISAYGMLTPQWDYAGEDPMLPIAYLLAPALYAGLGGFVWRFFSHDV